VVKAEAGVGMVIKEMVAQDIPEEETMEEVVITRIRL
jgi:hypothetical protein